MTSNVSARVRSRMTTLADDQLRPGLPTFDLALGHLAHDRPERRDARALERRQQQPSLAQVLRPVQHEYRVLAEDRLEERVRIAGQQVRLVARAQLADGHGTRD